MRSGPRPHGVARSALWAKKAKTEAQKTAGVKKAYNSCVDNGLLEPDAS